MARRPSKPSASVIPVEVIERKIFLVRGQKVMLDTDLAALYQVETRALIQAVNRNANRFPEDFMFQLSSEEAESLRSQIVISKVGRGGRRYLPYVFTEHGVAMLSSVLKSQRAVQINILIVRAFIRLREYLSTHRDLALKLQDIQRIQQKQGQHIRRIYSLIEKLLEPPPGAPKRRIGFTSSQ